MALAGHSLDPELFQNLQPIRPPPSLNLFSCGPVSRRRRSDQEAQDPVRMQPGETAGHLGAQGMADEMAPGNFQGVPARQPGRPA